MRVKREQSHMSVRIIGETSATTGYLSYCENDNIAT